MGGGYNGYVIYLPLPLAGGGISKIVTHTQTDPPTKRNLIIDAILVLILLHIIMLTSYFTYLYPTSN